MPPRPLVELLASIEEGGDVIDYLLDSATLNYGSLVEAPGGIRRHRGNDEWDEVHLLDSDGEALVRYIELAAAGNRSSFVELKRQLKQRGSPADELFTVVASRESDEGSLTSPLTHELTLFSIEEVSPSDDVETTFDLTYFTVDRHDVEPVYAEFLEALSVGDGQETTGLRDDVESVFSIREFTRRFYDEFGDVFRDTLQGAIQGLDAPADRSTYTRTVVNRVLFLLFIEEKGWLDGDVAYVENRYEAAKASDAMHVYEDFFEPLFFEALSGAAHEDDSFLGQVPFLNGGLFERRTVETDVTIDAAFFDALLDPDGHGSTRPKGLLRRYKFALKESTPTEQELVVDPAFVGRIFEMLMQEGERSEMGAFYTPKPITSYMSKNALTHHLRQTTDISPEQAATLVSDHTAPPSLSDDQLDEIDQSLRSVRILDPAVGSGAFIIAMLEELVAISEAIDETSADDRARFHRKEGFVADALYGVDIDPGGIELCTFRVWLHLMQDLHVSHSEFMDLNDEFALPNLDCNFFVGNSLVGEHDPTRIGVGAPAVSTEETEGLDATLAEFHDTRRAYQTAHGDEKAILSKQLDALTTEVEARLAVSADWWMTDVAEAAEMTFAWTTTVPEVMLAGGFDIVIGNPPYEGQSQQEYVGELARFYGRQYEFYETIPRMRHDLYQKFIIRGWELTREGGVLSYITSNTFYTIGSKQTTRHLLQQNRLTQLLQANPDTFDAAVHPAIFTLQKGAPSEGHTLVYVDAAETPIDTYRSLVSALILPTGDVEQPSAEPGDEHRALDLSHAARGYEVELSFYKNALRCAFFEPTTENMALYDTVIVRARELATEWAAEIRDSETLEENLDKIAREHLSSLEPGDVSILGLLTIGGQGLATASNDDYLAYLEGTRPAAKVEERNRQFAYDQTNDNQFNWMSRVIEQHQTADVDSLTATQKAEGISNTDRHWVPIVKGKGEPYYTPVTEYIDWSRDSVQALQRDPRARWQGFEYFFEEGLFISRGGTGDPVIRYAPPGVIDSSGGMYIPTSEQITARYLNGVLNSSLVQDIVHEFINGTVNTQIQDMRVVPVVCPTSAQRERIETLVDQAIAVRLRESDVHDPAVDISLEDAPQRSIDEIVDEIDEVVTEVYGIVDD